MAAPVSIAGQWNSIGDTMSKELEVYAGEKILRPTMPKYMKSFSQWKGSLQYRLTNPRGQKEAVAYMLRSLSAVILAGERNRRARRTGEPPSRKSHTKYRTIEWRC